MADDPDGDFVPVRLTRIDLTDGGDTVPRFTPWFWEMWDAENSVWRQPHLVPPVSRAAYLMAMRDYAPRARLDLSILPSVAFATALISLSLALSVLALSLGK